MLKHGPSESLPLKGRSCWAHSSEWEHNTMTHTQIFGSHESNTLDQLRDVASRAERAALMADGHLGYVMPIGGVAAYRNRSEEHTSELQSRLHLVCRLLLEKKKKKNK